MARFVRAAGAFVFLAVTASAADAAGQKDIDNAIAKGATFLKGRYARGVDDTSAGGGESYGIGPAALSGIAMLEAKVPANDPAMQNVIAAVRSASYTQYKTYQIALCLIFLDRLEDPADVPLIQMLAV